MSDSVSFVAGLV